MRRTLKAAILVIILLGNLIAVFPQGVEETEGCDTECCTSSQMMLHSMGEPSAAAENVAANPTQPFCIIQCRPGSEVPPSFSILTGTTKVHHVREAFSLCVLSAIAYTDRARFPDSPTTSFNGSSHRFLEHGSLLI